MKVLTVFDPSRVPTDTIADFLHWYDLTTEWVEDRDYDRTEGTVDSCVQWLAALRREFPPQTNGAEGTTRYIIGSTYIYARFAAEVSDTAEARARALADDFGLGVYVSGSGEVALPGGQVLA